MKQLTNVFQPVFIILAMLGVAVVWARTSSGAPDPRHIPAVNNVVEYNHQSAVIYPNSERDCIRVSDLPKGTRHILFYDQSGRLALIKDLINKATVETCLLSNGLYYYTLRDESEKVITTGQWTKK